MYKRSNSEVHEIEPVGVTIISDKHENMETDGHTSERQYECEDGCQHKMCCDLDSLKPPATLQELVDGLHKLFSSDKVNVEMVQTFMTLYKSNPKEWKKFAKFDQHRYTRNLVDAGNGKFNLMVLCWNESQGSSIHSHANAHCFMKVLDGNVQEQLYDWPTDSDGEKEMNLRRTNIYDRNQVAYICDELGLHRVENPSNVDKAVTLHLYSPPFEECDTFDEKTGHKNKVHVTFWSKFGYRTPFGKADVDVCDAPENN